jgi:hypothetical protein
VCVPCLLRVQVDDTYLKERRRASFVVVWIGCRLLTPVFVVCDSALLQNGFAVVVAGTVTSVCCTRRHFVVVVLGCRSLPPAASPISRKAPVLGFVDVSVVTGMKALPLSPLLFSCPSCCIRRYHAVAIVGTVR